MAMGASAAVGTSATIGTSASVAVAKAEAGVAALLRLLRTYGFEIVFAAWGAEIAEAPVVVGVLGTLVPRLGGVLGSWHSTVAVSSAVAFSRCSLCVLLPYNSHRSVASCRCLQYG